MLRRLLIAIVRGYQLLISPWLPPSCRFEPTCSHYAIEALSRYGAFRGGWLALRRLGRCHPFCAGGYDPVPGSPSCEHHTNPVHCHCDAERPKNDALTEGELPPSVTVNASTTAADAVPHPPTDSKL